MRNFVLILLWSLSTACMAGDKLVVVLDWFMNPNHAPLFVAESQGYFRDQGLDVEMIGPADPDDPVKFVAAKKADIAITYQPQYLMQVDQGLPLKEIGVLIDKPLNCLTVLASSPIKSIADLKGKKIGTSSNGMNNVMLSTMLAHHGLSLRDVTVINMHYDLTQALLTQRVDAVTGMMRNFEVTQMRLLGKPGRVFYPEREGMPGYAELIFVAHKDAASQDKMRRFLIAVKAGEVYLQAHPEATWEAFAKAHPENNNVLNHTAWRDTLPYFAKDPSVIAKKPTLRFAEYMKAHKMIRNYEQIN